MTNVMIPDGALRAALESAGVASKGSMVDAAELEHLTHLDWSEDGVGESDPEHFAPISDLSGLEHATRLRVLGLGGSSLETLAPLAGHPALEELWLTDNLLVDVSAVAGMPRLRIGVFDSNRTLLDIGPLAATLTLTYVNITHTKVSDLTPLGGLARLAKLSFYGLRFSPGTASFEILVELGHRGCELLGDPVVLAEIRAEVDRRKALEVAARRAELMTEPPGDGLLEALLSARLDELALRWKEGGPRARDGLGRTLLHMLAAAPNVEETLRASLTRALVAAGVDVNAVQLCAPATSALGLAISKSRSPEYLALLIELGADPDAGRSRPPLLIAVESAPSRVELLLAAGADVAPVFARIVECGSADLVKRVLAAAPQLARTEDLVRAVKRKSEDVVRALLEAGVDPNGPTAQDSPVLHYVEGAAMFDLLVDAGADVNARNALGATPIFAYLQLASRSPAVAATLVQKALLAGAAVNVRSKTGTSIHVLAQAHAAEAVALVPILGEFGEKLDAWVTGGAVTAFDIAASAPMKAALKAAKVGSGKAAAGRVAKQLASLASGDATAWAAAKILAGANQAKLLAPYSSVVEQKLRALGEPLASAFAAFEATSESVVVLLADGVDGVTVAGAPLLHSLLMRTEIAEAARQDAARALLAAGASPDALDAMGTPALNVYLDYTKAWDMGLVAELATEAAVRPNIARTALAIAVGRGLAGGAAAREVVDLLIERGSDLGVVVGAACYGGRLDLVRRAVEAGAAIPDGALHSAVYSNATDVAAYLLERGVDPNQRATVRPPIVDANSVEMLDLLVAHGGDPFVVTAQGETPLHLAARLEVPVTRIVALVQRLESLGISRSVPDAHGHTALAQLEARQEPEFQPLPAGAESVAPRRVP